jgi:hypothetical protein
MVWLLRNGGLGVVEFLQETVNKQGEWSTDWLHGAESFLRSWKLLFWRVTLWHPRRCRRRWHHSPLPKDTTLHPRRLHSSAAVVGEPQILQVLSSWASWEVPCILWNHYYVHMTLLQWIFNMSKTFSTVLRQNISSRERAYPFFFFSLDIYKVLELLKMEIGIFFSLLVMGYRKWKEIEIWMSADTNTDTCKRVNVNVWYKGTVVTFFKPHFLKLCDVKNAYLTSALDRGVHLVLCTLVFTVTKGVTCTHG